MEKGYIKVPISEVWEIINKPRRFFSYIIDEIKKLPIGEYQYLDFTQEEKDEIVKMFLRIKKTGSIKNNN